MNLVSVQDSNIPVDSLHIFCTLDDLNCVTVEFSFSHDGEGGVMLKPHHPIDLFAHQTQTHETGFLSNAYPQSSFKYL